MSTSARPAIKRQYGSRKTSLASSGSSIPSSSSPSSSQRDPQSTPSIARFRTAPPSSDWDEVIAETSLSSFSLSLSSEKEGPSSSPPTSPADARETGQAEEDQMVGSSQGSPRRAGLRERKLSPIKASTFSFTSTSNSSKAKAKAPAGNLFSFFKRAEPVKRARVDSSDEGNSDDAKKTEARPTKKVNKSTLLKPVVKSTTAKKTKLEQLYLDPFETGGHSTMSCSVCSMSYSRTPDDMELHKKHHKRVVDGCEWISGDDSSVTVVEEGVDWNGNEGGKILMVDGLVKGAIGRRIKDILATVDQELSSSALLDSQLAQSKIVLFVTAQKKVIAAAVIQRIQFTYRVIPSSSGDKTSLIRFGEEEGAVFCSPTLHPTLLGVHRIWTCATHRRAHLASLLLDAAASRFIYACPISKENRSRDFAFSQPTGAGMSLARRWTGTDAFGVFVE